MIPGTIPGMDGMLLITVTDTIAGTTGDGITVLHGVLLGVDTFIILYITIMVV